MIPIEIDDIEAAWLTEALASCLDAGVEVHSFSVEPIGVGVGLMGLLYRLDVEYRGGDGPETVIVKLPVLLDATREVAAAYRFYEKEVAFYRELAAETPFGTPIVHLGVHDPNTDNFVLVMEDICTLRAADQVAGCGHDDAVAAVTALARHHAAFWNDPRFGTDELAWLPFGSDAPTPEGVQKAFDAYWGPFVEFMGDHLSPEVRAAGEWLPGAARYLLTAPPEHPLTVVHGDYRLDNLFFAADGAVTAIDWQIVVKGVGGYDFAYFVSQSISAADRRAWLDELVDVYLGTLRAAGAEYPEEQFWYDVRRSVLFCLAYPVQIMALDLSDPRAEKLARELSERSMTAIVELGALDLVGR